MNGYFQQIGAWPEGGKRLARAYVLGLFGSLIFTLAAYFLVAAHALPQNEAIGIVVALALAQVATQLICFCISVPAHPRASGSSSFWALQASSPSWLPGRSGSCSRSTIV